MVRPFPVVPCGWVVDDLNPRTNSKPEVGRSAPPVRWRTLHGTAPPRAHRQEVPLFRRSKAEPVPADPETPTKLGGKGRPTPSRKEAQAAARARAKVPRTRKEQLAAQRAARSESSQRVRQAMKSGDERYLPARDRGPVRRFIRDFVDARFSVMELMVPILVVTLVLGWSGNAYLVSVGSTMTFGALVLIALDMVILRFRLRHELGRRFPGESTKGATYYALMRALQMKFMRMPKAQVKIGERLPDSYR